jgi:TolB-like protein
MGKNIQRTKPNDPGFESPWSDEAIREQLNRILGHPEFQATDKMRDFLRYVVEESLAGRSSRIKGFSIAIEVFGRDSDFDAAHDPVVRIQAGRLRRAIERYYLIGGRQDLIYIDIPKGSYIPVFAKGPGPKPPPRQGKAKSRQTTLAESCPVVMIMPFKDLTGKPEYAYLGLGLATELSMELGNCADLRIVQYREGSLVEENPGIKPDFTVKGSVFCDDRNLKIIAQLFDSKTGVQLWVESLKSPFESAHLIDFQEKSANSIAAHIASEHGAIMRAMTSRSSQQLISDLTTYQAVLKGYTYWEKVNVDTYQQAFEALQQQIDKGCDSGLCFTMLSLLYTDNISYEYFDLNHTPLNEALHLAREGTLLTPGNQLGHLALARAHFLQNELKQALSNVETALVLQPESLLFMDAIGYMLVLLGEWDRGEQLVRKAIHLNPFYRIYARYAIWLNAFRQQEYTRALEETEWIAEIGTFWGPLARAATLGHLACPEKGHEEVQRLLVFKPNFAERGRLLIGHAIKFPEVAERVIEGLSVAGLHID